MLKKNKKIISFASILGMVFLQIMPIYVQAAAVSESATTGPASNTDTSSVSNISDTVENKVKGPTVSIAFTSDNYFKEGSKVTATATTDGFYDSSDKLYYTWYIKHEGCGLTKGWENGTKEDNADKVKNCDMDGDGIITPNDWKITATRFVVKGNFDRNSEEAKKLYDAGETGTIEKESGIEAVPGVTDDKKDWIKNFKRSDGKLIETNGDDAPNCYVQNPTSGRIYELRSVTPDFSNNSCPAGYVPACIKDSSTTCTVLNPAFTGTDPLCWPEDVGTNPSYNPTLCTNPKSITQSFHACVVSSSSAVADMAGIFNCGPDTDPQKAADQLETYGATISCKDDGTPICAKTASDTKMIDLSGKQPLDPNQESVLGVIFKQGAASTDICSEVAKPNPVTNPATAFSPPPNFLDNLQPFIDADHESCGYLASGLIDGLSKDATISGVVVHNGQTLVEANAKLKLSCTFGKTATGNICKHLFPYFPKQNNVPVDNKISIDMGDSAAGDGKFNLKEKQFWWANPAVSSTKEKGIPDEASVIGLGLDSMSWTYVPGDEIGVAVEGTTNLATEHEDATYRIMWAFSKDTCTELKKIEDGNFYTENSGIIGVRTTEFDLDKCLEENLVTPGDSGISSMTTTLTATPDNPINDATGMTSDSVKVIASADNATDLNSIYYTWHIEKPTSDDGKYPTENTEFTDITNAMITNKSLANSDRIGLGKDELNFLLNLPDTIVKPTNGIFYLRIRVTAEENSGKNNQTSTGVLVIKVRQQGNKTNVFPVSAGDDGMLSLDSSSICSSLGTDGTTKEDEICDVPQNKIVAIKITPAEGDTLSGITWTVNNVSMLCDSSMSTACSDGKVLIFPILGNVGEAINVVATAKSSKTKGTVEIVRNFDIVEPSVAIISSDGGAWPKLLGKYLNSSRDVIDGKETPDYSTEIFETNLGNTVTFSANIDLPWVSASSYDWSVDGEAKDQPSFLVDKAVGESYNISLTAKTLDSEQITKINNLRKALLKYWGVSPEDSAGQDEELSADIQLNVVDTANPALASSNKTGIFASLITNLPENLMFLLKIVLTSIVVMFSVTLLFAFIPESIFEKSEEESEQGLRS